MAIWKETLIELYTQNSPDSIANNPQYRALCEQYVGNPAFQAAREKVEKAAIHVEVFMSQAGTRREEVISALRLLRCLRVDPEQQDLAIKLLTVGHRPHWTPEQQSHFDNTAKALRLRFDYFLSFTTRYEHVAGENPVNSSYKHFILKVLTRKEWNEADRAKENLLAWALHALLAQAQGHKGFFFPTFQFDNTPTEHMLEQMLRDSFVFIQLVQHVMFRPPESGKNYCHWEYSLTLEQLKQDRNRDNRILFALAERDRNAFVGLQKTLYPDYEPWHRDVSSHDFPEFPEVNSPKEADDRFHKIKNLVEQKLADKIEEAWDREIESVPG